MTNHGTEERGLGDRGCHLSWVPFDCTPHTPLIPICLLIHVSASLSRFAPQPPPPVCLLFSSFRRNDPFQRVTLRPSFFILSCVLLVSLCPSPFQYCPNFGSIYKSSRLDSAQVTQWNRVTTSSNSRPLLSWSQRCHQLHVLETQTNKHILFILLSVILIALPRSVTLPRWIVLQPVHLFMYI